MVWLIIAEACTLLLVSLPLGDKGWFVSVVNILLPYSLAVYVQPALVTQPSQHCYFGPLAAFRLNETPVACKLPVVDQIKIYIIDDLHFFHIN